MKKNRYICIQHQIEWGKDKGQDRNTKLRYFLFLKKNTFELVTKLFSLVERDCLNGTSAAKSRFFRSTLQLEYFVWLWRRTTRAMELSVWPSCLRAAVILGTKWL